MILRRKYSVFELIAIMLLVSSLLNLFGNNIPILGSFRFLWAPVLILYILVSSLNVIKLQEVRYALLYGFLFVGILQYSLWEFAGDWYIERILDDFYALIVAILFYSALVVKGNKSSWNYLSKVGLVFIAITGFMTIIATQIDSYVVRASYSKEQFELENYEFLYRFGFGSYGYMTAIVALIPILIYFYKNDQWLHRRTSLGLLVFFVFVIISSQIFANILVAFIIILFGFYGNNSYKRLVTVTTVFLVIVALVPDSFWINILVKLSTYFPANTDIHYKLIELSGYFDVQHFADSSNTFGYRAERYPMLFDAFIANPIFGDASYLSRFKYEMEVGGHLHWMSRLALWGIIGFVVYVLILYKIFSRIAARFSSDFKYYYILSLLSVVILGSMKAISGREPYIILLVIIPGLFYSQKQAKPILTSNISRK